MDCYDYMEKRLYYYGKQAERFLSEFCFPLNLQAAIIGLK